MANSLLNPSIITKRAMVEFKNAMVLLEKVDRQLDPLFEGKAGDTISVRKRVRYIAHNAADITSNINDTVEGKIAVTLNQRRVVPMQFDSKELSLDIEEFSDRYIRPAMIELAQQVESAIAGEYTKIWNFTGTPGTNPSTFLQIGTVGAIMDESAVPAGMGDRCAFYTPAASLTLADGLKGVFPNTIATNAIENALVNNYAGFSVYKSQSLITHTVGAHGGTPLVDGASQNVTYATSKDSYSQTLVTNGWTNSVTGILLEGDTFTIANVYAVNPRTRQSTGRLQSFVVRADANSGASTGPATLTISPAIITSGPYQTVSAAPANDAAITVTSGTAGASYSQNLAFHKDAITVAFGQLVAPVGNVQFGRETMDGVSVRLVGDYDILTDINTWRFDVLFGVEAQNPGMAVRHVGA
jgi:hypothetical protein